MQSRSKIYWACQILGWGAYSAIGLSMVTAQGGWQPHAAIGYALFFFYSIAITDAERRFFIRRQWLHLPMAAAAPRLVGVSILAGAVQTIFVIGIAAALDGKLGGWAEPRVALSTLFGISAANAAWVWLYVAITSRHRAQDLKLALREAELRALEAQVNPHFLFNCLNTIRGMIVENPANAQEMITRLANILRYNLRPERLPTAPLAREVEIVSDYLALESARFEDRLKVKFAVAPEAAQIPVPTMLVQTLVENALKHGIAHLPQGGDVVIRATVTSDMLVVKIENSGILVPPAPGATQLGLNNARERLRILYGCRAKLDLANCDGDRVAATVLIPRTI